MKLLSEGLGGQKTPAKSLLIRYAASRLRLPAAMTGFQGAYLAVIELVVIELDFGVGIHRYPSKTVMSSPVARLYPSPARQFGNHFVCRGDEFGDKNMPSLQGAGEDGEVFYVFVNHLVSQVAHGHPFVSGFEQT
jgi:hypothetical protein